MNMQGFQRDEYENRIMELSEEEEKLQEYLSNNSASMADQEVKRLKHSITGIRMEQELIRQVMDGGYY
ncbi:MAG TPA: hypothetical protein DGK91_06315 [Clostridium sp.]|jgi:ribosomal protein S2|nr:hypothetical protein [Clostridia bacterium]HCW04165.1 hypothetical protein [Clostridium sp.]